MCSSFWHTHHLQSSLFRARGQPCVPRTSRVLRTLVLFLWYWWVQPQNQSTLGLSQYFPWDVYMQFTIYCVGQLTGWVVFCLNRLHIVHIFYQSSARCDLLLCRRYCVEWIATRVHSIVCLHSTFIRFLHGGQPKSGWLEHLNTSILLFYFFVIPGRCSSMDPACRVCVNGTARFECVRCEDGSSLDPTSNQCQRKSVSVSLSVSNVLYVRAVSHLWHFIWVSG